MLNRSAASLSRQLLSNGIRTVPRMSHRMGALSTIQTRSFLFNRPLIAGAASAPTPAPPSTTTAATTAAPSVSPVAPVAPVVEAKAVEETVQAAAATQTSQQVTEAPALIDATLSQEFSLNLDKVINSAADIVNPEAQNMIAITKVGDLETLGLGGWGPVGIVQQILEGIYLTSGMPWWATIAATTVLFRVALFPFVIKSQRAAAQLGNLKPLILPIQEEMKAAQAIKNKEKQMAAFTKLQAIYKEANVNPLAGLWGLAQVPVFMSMFFGLKGMAELPVPGFSTGGALWFSDLSAMDPTYILPITAAGTMLVVMEYSMEAQASANAAQSQMIKSVMRPLLFFSIFFTGAMPAAVFAYWVTSNFLTLGQFFLLRDQRVKDYLGIPAIKGDASGPAKALSTGIARDGMLAVRPMNFGEAWGLAKDEAQRRKVVVDAAVKK